MKNFPLINTTTRYCRMKVNNVSNDTPVTVAVFPCICHDLPDIAMKITKKRRYVYFHAHTGSSIWSVLMELPSRATSLNWSNNAAVGA